MSISEKQYFADSRIRIALTSATTETTIYTDTRDWCLGLAETCWAPDSKVVGTYVCNMCGGPLVVAYDTKAGRTVKSAEIEERLREKIRHKYGLSAKTDPFKWGCTNDGLRAYMNRTNRFDH